MSVGPRTEHAGFFWNAFSVCAVMCEHSFFDFILCLFNIVICSLLSFCCRAGLWAPSPSSSSWKPSLLAASHFSQFIRWSCRVITEAAQEEELDTLIAGKTWITQEVFLVQHIINCFVYFANIKKKKKHTKETPVSSALKQLPKRKRLYL